MDELPLFPYQEASAQKIVPRKKTTLVAPPGAGKSRTIIEGIKRSFEGNPHCIRVLVVCTGPALATWLREPVTWGLAEPERIIHITGDAYTRGTLWNQARTEKRPGFHVYICNNAVFVRDYTTYVMAPHEKSSWVKVLICDEYHKYMTRRQSSTYKYIARLSRYIDRAILCTGTPISKDASSLWNIFHVAAPKLFGSYHRFVATYCITEESSWGVNVIGIKNIKALRAIIEQYLIVIPESVVAGQLPEGKRNTIPVSMNKVQQEVYDKLCTDLIYFVHNSEGDIASIVTSRYGAELLIRLRMLLCCPKLIDPSLGMGVGFEAIVDMLSSMDNPTAAIFVPFRDACTYVANALNELEYKVYVLKGGMTPQDTKTVIDNFDASSFIQPTVLICTIDFAESFDLNTCNTSFFLGYGFRVKQNNQAEGRTRRASSLSKFVTWNYVKYINTIDEEYAAGISAERQIIQRILQHDKSTRG